MNDGEAATRGQDDHGWADIAIRLGLAALIVFWSFLLLLPFLAILIWAAVLGVALRPLYLWLKTKLGDRSTLAAFLVTSIMLLVILGPVGVLGTAMVNNLTDIATDISTGEAKIPPPPASVEEWPIIGKTVSNRWQAASEKLGETLVSFQPQIRAAAAKLAAIVGSVAIGVLHFAVAIIIAGFMFSRSQTIQENLKKFASRLAPQIGIGFVDLAGKTVNGVARGIMGISLIQSILFGLGALVAGIPFAGLLTFIVLIFSIVQVPGVVVVVPVIIYGWSAMETLSAAILTAYLVPVMLMDNILKPMLLGRGLPVPMLVIFIGVIGGTIAHGLIGLFVGPIILAIGYELAKAWLGAKQETAETGE